MRKKLILLMMILVLLVHGFYFPSPTVEATGGGQPGGELTFENSTVAPSNSYILSLPAKPDGADQPISLGLDMFHERPSYAGANYNVTIKVNGTVVNDVYGLDVPRLMNRDPQFELLNNPGLVLDVHRAGKWLTIFAPDVPTANSGSPDHDAAEFLLYISDLLDAENPNEIEIINEHPSFEMKISNVKVTGYPANPEEPINYYDFDDQNVSFSDSYIISLPAMPPRGEQPIVLALRMFHEAVMYSGAQYNVTIKVNGTVVNAVNGVDAPRLMNRYPQFELLNYPGLILDVHRAGKWLTIFAPDVPTANSGSPDGDAAEFVLNLSDLLDANNTNEIEIINDSPGQFEMKLRDIRVSWYDPDQSPFNNSDGSGGPGDYPEQGEGPGIVLEDESTLADQILKGGETKTILFPAMPAKADKIAVMSFNMYSRLAVQDGANWNAKLMLNQNPIRQTTAFGDERLVDRDSSLELTNYNLTFNIFNNDAIMTVFAPNIELANAHTYDGKGSEFVLNVSDLVRGVDGNELTIQNLIGSELIIRNLRFGWLDVSNLPLPLNEVPERGSIADSVTVGELTLLHGTAGGFAVQLGNGEMVRVESAIGMRLRPEAQSMIRAEDGEPGPDISDLTVQKLADQTGFSLQASWNSFELERTIRIEQGRVVWRETWTNHGEENAGLPFRHRLFMEEPASFVLGGDFNASGKESMSANPTLFIGEQQDGFGYGFVAESDWLRLLLESRIKGGVGELYTRTLALAPDDSIEFELSIVPVQEGGYWSMVQEVRERWGVSGLTLDAPTIWYYQEADGATPEERLVNSLGNLGPINLAVYPWQRLEFDGDTIHAQAYPKLPEGAPPTVGGTPDLDIDQFLTFEHREPIWDDLRTRVDRIHNTLPGVKVIQTTHPAMEMIYKPLQHMWPYDQEKVLLPDGSPFESAVYSSSWAGGMVNKGWGVLYYVPRENSPYLADRLDDLTYFMDEIGGDGIYMDEFSWAFTRSGYSRYDYRGWDGRSADLDENGAIIRLKTDNAYVTETAQLEFAETAISRGKFFLHNTSPALKSVNQLPTFNFVEAGNGIGSMGDTHLTRVPLVLGNFGDRSSTKGVFEATRVVLSRGAMYSPYDVNLHLNWEDNFISRMYPMTVKRIGEGFIIGEERVVTMNSGTFDLPAEDGKSNIRLYRYNENGALLDKEVYSHLSAEVAIEVPAGGLVIAERTEAEPTIGGTGIRLDGAISPAMAGTAGQLAVSVVAASETDVTAWASFTSSDSSVAEVLSGGVIVYKAAGTTLIGAIYGELTSEPITVEVVGTAASSAAPGKPVLSDDNGHNTGLLDGDYNLTTNLWWGSNGTVYRLYENEVLIETKLLNDQSPEAQTVSTAISGRANGVYTYRAELINSHGITTSDPHVVTVTHAAPGIPVLSHDNWDGGGMYTVTMNLWWGTNGTAYRLYENGTLVDTQPLAAATPGAQTASTAISGRAPGTYEYRVELVNGAGATSSTVMVVRVTGT